VAVLTRNPSAVEAAAAALPAAPSCRVLALAADLQQPGLGLAQASLALLRRLPLRAAVHAAAVVCRSPLPSLPPHEFYTNL
jgi:hypothetical protein